MRLKRITRWVVGTLTVLVAMGFIFYHFILDWEARPYCHKQVYTAFLFWMDSQANGSDGQTNGIGSAKISRGGFVAGTSSDWRTNAFPNIKGLGPDSLVAISEQMNGHMAWAKSYRYVPGLRQNDPGDLVLMYLDRPTRWTWHGPPATIFTAKAWIVVPVDFAYGGSRPRGPGELSERISEAEFRSRLQRTIEFVRTNERPNWQTVVAEHTKFLDSMVPVGR